MKKNTPVLVTTSKRGVFVGKLKKMEHCEGEGLVVHLKDARMVLYWPNRGVFSIQTRTDFDGFRLGDESPKLRIGYVDSIGPVEAEAHAAFMQVPTWKR